MSAAPCILVNMALAVQDKASLFRSWYLVNIVAEPVFPLFPIFFALTVMVWGVRLCFVLIPQHTGSDDAFIWRGQETTIYEIITY